MQLVCVAAGATAAAFVDAPGALLSARAELAGIWGYWWGSFERPLGELPQMGGEIPEKSD